MRTITVIGSTLSTPREYVTEATTWGQLKELVVRDFGDVSKMKITSKETRANYERDDAKLYDGDDTIYLTQSQIKAGAVDAAEMVKALKEEFTDALENVLDRLTQGEFDTPATEDNALGLTPKKTISEEDAAFLAELQNGYKG